MKDLRKLRRILKLVPADRKHIGEELIERITFMAGVLDDLQAQIQEHGTTDHFKQGVQEFDRESPALKSYNTTIQRYSLLYKQLVDLLPRPRWTKRRKTTCWNSSQSRDKA